MRKFSFLLAIVAVFAMSAAAFAGAYDISKIDTADADQGNIGKVAGGTGGTAAYQGTTATAYYLKAFNTISLDLGMKLTVEGPDSGTDDDSWPNALLVGAGTGAKLTSNVTAVEDFSSGADIMFTVGGWASIPEKFQLTYIAGWGADGKTQPSGSVVSGDITITAKSLDICLSKDGAAQAGYTAYLGKAVDEKFLLTYDSAALEGMAAKLGELKIGVISTGSSIKSADVKAADAAIKGLTVAFDSTTKNQLNIKGTATAEGDVTLAIYLADTDAADALAVKDGLPAAATGATLATPISADATEDAWIIATFDLSAEKTEIDKVIDQIAAKPAVSADVVAALKAGAKAIVLTASGDQAIVNGKVAVAKPLSDDMDSIQMRVAFLKLDGEGKVAAGTDPGSVRVVINDSTETNAVSFDVNNGTSPRDIATIQGVADVTITKDDAANGDYTAYVIQTPATGGSEARGAKPADAVTYASQKFKVLATEPYSKSSSGACDMGFGLVALSGLAALALRKRSK